MSVPTLSASIFRRKQSFSMAPMRRSKRASVLPPMRPMLGWEFISFGRPAAGEGFTCGYCPASASRCCVLAARSGLNVCTWTADRRSLVRALLSPESRLSAPWSMPVQWPRRLLSGSVRRLEKLPRQSVFSVSQLEQVVVCRYLGARMSEGKSLFIRAWDVLREVWIGKERHSSAHMVNMR